MPNQTRRRSKRDQPARPAATIRAGGARQGAAQPRRPGQRGAPEPRRPLPYVRIGLGVALGLVAVLLVYAVATGAIGLGGPLTGRQAAEQGRDHISSGQAHPPYNTVPPTSGWHYVDPAPWGASDKPVQDEVQVHNLEHGGIMIQYWCGDGCPDLVAQLKGIASRYRSKVILAPYDKPLPNRIALTAWTWIDTFDSFDEARIVDFIDRHKNRAPEQVPD